MHPWHSPANWYGPVQNSTQHHELWETWEGACSEKLEETQTIFPQHPTGASLVQKSGQHYELQEIWEGGWEHCVKLLRSVMKLNI